MLYHSYFIAITAAFWWNRPCILWNS